MSWTGAQAARAPLRHGDHACYLFDSDHAQRQAVAAFVADGLLARAADQS